MKNTMIERYSTDNYSKTNEFKKYIQKNSYFKTKEFQEKAKLTKQTRYNNKNYNNRKKSINSIFKFYYNNLIESNRLNKLVIPLFSLDDYKGVKIKYDFKCIKCENEFQSTLNYGIIPRCTVCFPIIRNDSIGENELYEYIKHFYQMKLY